MIPETEFHDRVVGPHLQSLFGADAVEHEKYLDQTTAYADYWVDLDVVILAIEVENDADSVRSGVAQALEYAQNDPRAVPVVIVPTGAVEDAQVRQLRDVCPIIELAQPGDSGLD